MADILTLPDPQRRIALFIQRNQGCTLSELVESLNLAEESVRYELNLLVAEGNISESIAGGSSRYFIQLAGSGIQVSQPIHQALTPGKPLSTIINPSGEFSVAPGETLELFVTVTNEGDCSALIDIKIDETSEPLHGWCLSPCERLALGRGQSGEVIFLIQIPLDALPGTYNYLLLVDAQEHYPEDTPIQHQSRFRVLPFVQEAVTVNDPTFTLLPVTSSTNPNSLPPGGSFPVQVIVHNRSDRVDRFRLTCPDIDPKWFTVIYPEGLPELGVVRVTDALELNPGDKGQIQLILTPPLDAVAAVYSPTIRLYSLDKPDLVLLEPVYFQIEPLHLLNVELVTLVGKVRNLTGLFEIQLYNGGNCPREITLEAKSVDGDDLCTYTLTPKRVRLLPKSYGVATLQVEPTSKWWKRPFYGRVFNFIVEIKDTQQLPLPNHRYQGTLIWEGRPWWHFLLAILGIVGVVAALIILIWWLFFRPKPLPQIVDFSPASNGYSEAEGDMVRLNWKIANPKRLQSLKLEGLSPDGMVITSPIVYDFSKGLPSELKSFCIQQVVLICKNVPTDARKSGSYIFQLTLVPLGKKGIASQTLKTSTVRIEPFPLPKILEFASPLPVYQEAVSEIIPPTTNQTAKTTATAKQTPNQTLSQSLTQNLTSNQNINQIKTPNETKTPTPTPTPNKILNPTPTLTQNPTPTPTKTPNQVIKNERILLNWKISHPEEIKTLKLIGRDPEGVVNVPEISFDFSRGIPQVLWKFCQLTQEGIVCRNLPTNATKAGTYIFELTILNKHGDTEILETKKTDPIKIEAIPIPIEIIEFKINGVNPLPKVRIPIDPNKPIGLLISWKVKGNKDTKVEILPTPGTVPIDGTILYPLSQEAGSETITIQVTNKAGEQKSRSVSIETFIPPPLPIATPSAKPSPPASGKPPGAALGSIPVLPPPGGSLPPSTTLPLPSPPPTAANPEAAPDGGSPPDGGATPSESGAAPLPQPPGGTPPLPPDNDSPPPAELPPQLN